MPGFRSRARGNGVPISGRIRKTRISAGKESEDCVRAGLTPPVTQSKHSCCTPPRVEGKWVCELLTARTRSRLSKLKSAIQDRHRDRCSRWVTINLFEHLKERAAVVKLVGSVSL